MNIKSVKDIEKELDNDIKKMKRKIFIVTFITIFVTCVGTYYIVNALKPYIEKLDKRITQAADTTIVIKNGKADTTIIIHK